MLDHYLHTAHAANLLLHPRWEPVTPTPPQPGVAPEELADTAAALAWFEAEYAVLLAAVHLAAATGFLTHAWQLPSTLAEFFTRQGHWADWAATENTALRTAQRHRDRRGQAHAHRSLGRALAWLGRFDEAHNHLQQAVGLSADLGDPAVQVETHIQLGAVFEQQGDAGKALAHNQQALDLYHRIGSARGLARVLNNIGWYHALLGEPEQALTHCRQALTLNREVGDRRIEAQTLHSVGYAHLLLGQHDQAIDHLQRSSAIRQSTGDRHGYAVHLDHLGDAYHAAGDRDAARHAWRQALDILDQLGVVRAGVGPGYPDADAISAKLHHLDTPDSLRPEQ
jgi:tetratricopeptide (TPR) repeat protein